MKKILFFCLPGIGDALMTTPTIKLLKDKFKNSEIDIACMFDGVKYVFKNNPNISNIYRLSLYKENKLIGLKQILDLRRKHYDITMTTTLTLEFKGVTEEILDTLIKEGYSKTKSEAVRYALLHLAEELSLIKPRLHTKAEEYAYHEIRKK